MTATAPLPAFGFPLLALFPLPSRLSGGLGERCSGLLVSCDDAGLCPPAGAALLAAGQALLGQGFESEQAAGGHAVLPRHDVVEDGVDGCAKVEEDKGHQVAVLADHCYLQGSGFEGFGK